MQLNIVNLDRNATNGAITTAHWTATETDGEYTASAYGAVYFDAPDAETMIPYAEVTQEDVMGWLEDKLDAAYGMGRGREDTEKQSGLKLLQDQLDAQITLQKAPTVLSGTPW